MKPYIARKLVEFAASLLILIPCVLLLAWESQLPNVIFFWFVLMDTGVDKDVSVVFLQKISAVDKGISYLIKAAVKQ